MTIEQLQRIIDLTNDATEIINRSHYSTDEHLTAADKLTAINTTIRSMAISALTAFDPPTLARDAARRQRSKPI